MIFFFMKIALLFLILVVLFKIILKSDTVALALIFTTVFTRAIFHLMGLPRMVPTLFTEVCVLMLLSKALYLKLFINQKPLKVPCLFPLLGMFIVSALSYLVNLPGLLPAIFFIRKTFIFYLFFIALNNLDLSEETITKINKYIIFFFLVQIPAAAVKYLSIGVDESWIGTISWQAGQLSTTFPLFAMSFLFAFYFFTREKKYLLLIGGFIFFGIVGQKRAFAICIPVIAFVACYLYGKREILKVPSWLKLSQMKYIALILIISFLGIFLSSRFLSDEMYGGRLDIRKVVNYIKWYNTRNQIAQYGDDNPEYTMGRYTITLIALNRLKSGGFKRELIGFGPGTMILSPHLGRSKRTAYKTFGIYGAYSGFVFFVLQVGLLGVAFLTYFLLRLFLKVYSIYRRSSNFNFKMVALGFLVATFVILFDFFVYSESTLFLGVITPVYFYIATVVLREDFEDSYIFRTVPYSGIFSRALSVVLGKD